MIDLKHLVEKFTVVAMAALDKPELIIISGLAENDEATEIARGDFVHENKMKNVETFFRMGLALGQSSSANPVVALVIVSPEDNGLIVAGIEPDIESEAFAAYAIFIENTIIEEISLNDEVGLPVRAAVHGYFSGVLGLGKRPSLDETFNPARKEQYLN